MAPEKLKRVVIKEELVELTGDFKYALILNQFIYWTERRRDFDKFIEEEKKRARSEGRELNISKTGGWVYKSSDDLADELMLGKSKPTLSRYVKKLEEMGYLESRQNPQYSWDKTKQYRVNLIKVNRDLLELGYHLEGYRFEKMYKDIARCLKETERKEDKSAGDSGKKIARKEKAEKKAEKKKCTKDNFQTDDDNLHNTQKKDEKAINPGGSDISNFNDRGFNMKDRDFKMKPRSKNMKHRDSKNETAIPETTTEITSKTTTETKDPKTEEHEQRASAREETPPQKTSGDYRQKKQIDKIIPPEIIDAFMGVFERKPTAFEAETLADQNSKSAIIKKAIELTALNSRDGTLSYTLALLRDWREKGLGTVEQVEEMLASHRENRGSKKQGQKNRSSRGSSQKKKRKESDSRYLIDSDGNEYLDPEHPEVMKQNGWNTPPPGEG
ncbi:DnaD domain protein [Halarsenatibacter silvermanii]|uniref:DnaD and phage-associated domain-containing protein n=1 Tax=Halarsenatibacter silvermanii TaxID=321763 RepID=A0A1G9MXX9_9FIRM|nr:DnaD domain protein [Halarsenatibacter silvermanii]SDL78983.1 DnaD and phage-associated domain-containing protein [Halarsenatibacter silvermanii]